MRNLKKTIRIVILEDNIFYNRIFSEKLKFYVEALKQKYTFVFDIESYKCVDDFLANLKLDTDVAFIDYYLDNNITAMDVIKKIQYRCPECKIIILSQYYSIYNSLTTIFGGASVFIQKGVNAVPKSCHIVERVIARRLKYGF